MAKLRWIVVVVLAWVALPSSVVSAHTELEATVPADGALVAGPVGEVSVAFTDAVELVGNGFEALDPQGDRREPAVATADGVTFLLRFDPPLAGGTAGVRYQVRADDGHVITGSFSFTVEAPPPTTTAPTTAASTTTPTTTPTSTTAAPAAPVSSASAATSAATTPSTTPAVADPSASGISATASTDALADATAAGSDDGGGSTGVVVAIVVGLVVAAVVLLVLRSRSGAMA